MTFPREGKFTSSHFLASKDIMGLVLYRQVLWRELQKKKKSSEIAAPSMSCSTLGLGTARPATE